ncbi:hypothetical protein BDV24DRAFT_137381 [Aspergillus arachidicola]|uniref:Uncharacterized protein n=1 Tax=Aspergillus arachidicola TaxID=656916 RepID=A0A5N6Y060_9EURO|nr:hypothetical protein BDV24DRAFT_137381 [Aspergillus arachidicola]
MASKQLTSWLSLSCFASHCRFSWNLVKVFQELRPPSSGDSIKSRFRTAVASRRSPSVASGVAIFRLTSFTAFCAR